MNTTLHLSADQIDDALIGDLAAEAQTHLDSCDACQFRVAELATPLASFREVSLAWAERRSATMPAPARVSSSRRAPWITAAATAVAALAIAVPLLHHHQTTAVAPQVAAIASSTAPATRDDRDSSAEQIAHDNQMLAAIDETLNAPIQQPVGMTHHNRADANLLRE